MQNTITGCSPSTLLRKPQVPRRPLSTHHHAVTEPASFTPPSSQRPPPLQTPTSTSVVNSTHSQPTSFTATTFNLPRHHLLHNSISIERCLSLNPSLYYQLMIGIVTHSGNDASGRLSKYTNASNIPASYVKFVESVGAHVIPLIYNEPWNVLYQKLQLVNGVLFTGGWAFEGLYFDIIKKVFEVTLVRNDVGDHFPLFTTCLGFELISMIVSQDHDILEHFKAQNQASTLQFANILDIQGSIFERFPSKLLRKLSTECFVMQNHKKGLPPRRLQENVSLSSFFKILTTSFDENNVYVSTAQAY